MRIRPPADYGQTVFLVKYKFCGRNRLQPPDRRGKGALPIFIIGERIKRWNRCCGLVSLHPHMGSGER